jgi:N-methylhydantoinase A
MHISTDIGGTFTDFVIVDECGKLITFKVPSTPAEPELAIQHGLSKYFTTRSELGPETEPVFSHATTVATNSVIERKGSKTAIVITKGFSDLLEIGRQIRPSLYDFNATRTKPLVPRSFTFDLEERLGADGKIIKELNKTRINNLINKIERLNQTKFKKGPIETIAVNFLFSFLNPVHEKMVEDQFRKRSGVIPVLSSDVLPEFREYERFSTTVLEAFLRNKIGNYLGSLRKILKRNNIHNYYIMQSNGGVTSGFNAEKRSITTLLSGPAAGVAAAKYVGDKLGIENLITFDMGGTSTDVSTVINGKMKWTSEGNIEGLPLSIPILDIVTIGAGGGSNAWMDKGGALRVGPESSGAVPGPICYAKGGNMVTVTDCDLLAGYLDPSYFLDGEMNLDYELAERVTRKLAARTGLKFHQAVNGVIKIVNSNMIRALRKVSVERGHDPQDFTLLAFGGAGPVHAAALARELNIPKVIVPPSPGTFSALGLIVTSIQGDYSKTELVSTKGPKAYHTVEKVLKQLIRSAKKDLKNIKGSRHKSRFISTVDMRYKGQSYEINIEYINNIENLVQMFHNAHKLRYGYSSSDKEVEIVNIRLTVITEREKPEMIQKLKISNDLKERNKTKSQNYRNVIFDNGHELIKTPIYKRFELQPGFSGKGPLIIEEPTSTLVIHPDMKFKVDPFGIIHILT